MTKFWLLLLFLAFLLPAASAVSCHPDDLHALRGFAQNFSGGGVLLRTMWSDTLCCSWEGVGCDGTSGRVTTLSLPGRDLAGPIPGASLAGLTRLEELNLANNRLVGTIPSWIGELDNLCYLDLSHNSLVGDVPESLQIRLRGLNIVGRSMCMAFTNLPLHVKHDQITLDGQPNVITGSNNSVRSGTNNVVSGSDNTVISGSNNVVSGNHNTVRSGDNNVVSGNHNTMVRGNDNVVSGSNHVVSGNNKVVTGG